MFIKVKINRKSCEEELSLQPLICSALLCSFRGRRVGSGWAVKTEEEGKLDKLDNLICYTYTCTVYVIYEYSYLFVFILLFVLSMLLLWLLSQSLALGRLTGCWIWDLSHKSARSLPRHDPSRRSSFFIVHRHSSKLLPAPTQAPHALLHCNMAKGGSGTIAP